jgi:hypothetical protein
MRRIILITVCILLFVTSIFIPGYSFAEATRSINVTGAYWVGFSNLLGGEPQGSQFSLEYEKLLGASRTALLLGLSMAEYDKDPKSGWFGGPGEKGTINSVNLGLRFYPIGSGKLKRLFFGGSLGLLKNEWTWHSAGSLDNTTAKGDSNGMKVDLEIGHRFNLGSEKISFMPAFHMGRYYLSDHSGKYTNPPAIAGQPFNEESALDYYFLFSLSLGFAF